jgi:tetratricopeptide (TPR) repeat protein
MAPARAASKKRDRPAAATGETPGPPASEPASAGPRFVAAASGIFLLALILRLVHVWQLRESPFFEVLLGDARGYDEWARRIAGGDWIGRDVFYQAPLYPYFLGAIYATLGRHLLAVRVIQAVLGSGSCVFLALAGRRFFSARAGLIAGAALALFAPSIFFDGLLQKSVLDVFFLTIALWMAARLMDERDRPALWLSLGLTMGALSLTRENALVLIAVIVIWALVAPAPRQANARPASPRIGSRLRYVAVFVAGLAIVLVPVAARNAYVGGGFYLTTSQFGPNFYIGNNPRADGTYMSLRFGRGAPEYERQDATDLAEHALGRTLSPSEVSSYWTDRALNFIGAHPAAWLRLEARKFLLLWNAREMLDTESLESYAEWSWPLRVLAPFTHFGVIVPLALLGIVLVWPERSRLALLLTMLVAYAASVLLFYVFARYRLPLMPLLLLFAGSALARIPDLAAASSSGFWTPRAFAVLLSIVAAAVLANWPLLSPRLMQAITETNLATALDADGRSDDALVHYRRAVELEPQYAPAYNNLAVVQRAHGSLDAAVATYRRALAIQPDYPDAHYNLANALLAQNNPREAQEHFEIALRSIPDSAGVRNNLGIALSAQGDTGGAIAAFRNAVAADSRSAKAHRNLGDALSDAGRTGEAIEELRTSIALDPADPSTHYNLGHVLLGAGRLDEAITEFRAAIERAPRMVEAHNNLGIAYGSAGDLASAIAAFERAIAIDPGFADAQVNLDKARAASGMPKTQRPPSLK